MHFLFAVHVSKNNHLEDKKKFQQYAKIDLHQTLCLLIVKIINNYIVKQLAFVFGAAFVTS